MKTFKVYLRLKYKTDVIYVNALDLDTVKNSVYARLGKKSILKVVEVL